MDLGYQASYAYSTVDPMLTVRLKMLPTAEGPLFGSPDMLTLA